MMGNPITAEQMDRWRQFAQAGWSLEARAVLALLHEVTTLRAERDALRAQSAVAEQMAYGILRNVTVTDCNEACEHPACDLLRAARRYRALLERGDGR